MDVTFDGPIQVMFADEDRKRLDDIFQKISETENELKNFLSGFSEKPEKTKADEKKKEQNPPTEISKQQILDACGKVLNELCGDDKASRKKLSLFLKDIASDVSNKQTSKPSELSGENAQEFIEKIKRLSISQSGEFSLLPF